jgi:molybdate transport system regulatory protein
MKLSTRNQLAGTVLSVVEGPATAIVKIELPGGSVLTSSITREAATELGLQPGSEVVALIKASDVAIGIE